MAFAVRDAAAARADLEAVDARAFARDRRRRAALCALYRTAPAAARRSTARSTSTRASCAAVSPTCRWPGCTPPSRSRRSAASPPCSSTPAYWRCSPHRAELWPLPPHSVSGQKKAQPGHRRRRAGGAGHRRRGADDHPAADLAAGSAHRHQPRLLGRDPAGHALRHRRPEDRRVPHPAAHHDAGAPGAQRLLHAPHPAAGRRRRGDQGVRHTSWCAATTWSAPSCS